MNLLPQNSYYFRKMTDMHMEYAIDLLGVGVERNQIVALLEDKDWTKHGGKPWRGVPKDISNLGQKLRAEELAGRSPMEHLAYVAEMHKKEWECEIHAVTVTEMVPVDADDDEDREPPIVDYLRNDGFPRRDEDEDEDEDEGTVENPDSCLDTPRAPDNIVIRDDDIPLQNGLEGEQPQDDNAAGEGNPEVPGSPPEQEEVRMKEVKYKQLDAFFFASQQSLRLAKIYPEVLMVDATYSTNTSAMPLVQLVGMDCNKNSFTIALAFISGEGAKDFNRIFTWISLVYAKHGIRRPSIIITDACKASISCAVRIFDTSRIVLCRWHVRQAIRGTLRKKTKMIHHRETEFLTDWDALVLSNTTALFVARWDKFWSKWQPFFPEMANYIAKTWVRPHKEKLIDVWVQDLNSPTFDHKTTSPCEGMHSYMKHKLSNSCQDLWTTFKRMERAFHKKIEQVYIEQGMKRTTIKACYVNQALDEDSPMRKIVGDVSVLAMDTIHQQLLADNCSGDDFAKPIDNFNMDTAFELMGEEVRDRALGALRPQENEAAPHGVPIDYGLIVINDRLEPEERLIRDHKRICNINKIHGLPCAYTIAHEIQDRPIELTDIPSHHRLVTFEQMNQHMLDGDFVLYGAESCDGMRFPPRKKGTKKSIRRQDLYIERVDRQNATNARQEEQQRRKCGFCKFPGHTIRICPVTRDMEVSALARRIYAAREVREAVPCTEQSAQLYRGMTGHLSKQLGIVLPVPHDGAYVDAYVHAHAEKFGVGRHIKHWDPNDPEEEEGGEEEEEDGAERP